MKLINGILRPGIVLEYLGEGKIKASAPGLFTEEDKDKLPPIMPFFEIFGQHTNSFSEPHLNEEVWILNLLDNPLQLYWFRKDNHLENNKEIPWEGDQTNVEVICNRESGLGWATLCFSDGTGWLLKNDESKLQIHKDGSIDLGIGIKNRNIRIDTNCVSVGSDSHPAVYGDELESFLMDLCDLLQNVQSSAINNPYTSVIGTSIATTLPNLKARIPNIKSQHVKIA